MAIAIATPNIRRGGRKEKESKPKAAIVVRVEPSKAEPVDVTDFTKSFSCIKRWLICIE
jgi:hypothetical protein